MTHTVRILTLSVAMLAAAVASSFAAPRTYTFDRAHSEVGFNVRHFFNKTHGRFEDYKGTLVFDDKSLPASSVELTIQDSSVYTAKANGRSSRTW